MYGAMYRGISTLLYFPKYFIVQTYFISVVLDRIDSIYK